ncbi:hypothetical protein OT109_14900 [Phycisphaeraceae bacterium D3-23]
MKHTRDSPSTRSAAAFSLLEMVLSLTVLSIVFTAVGSVFVLAAKVIPEPGSALASGVEQSRALTQVVEDLQAARYVTESTTNSVTIVVDDRTGDGLPDRLRYAWAGSAGDPLTLSINGSTPATVAEDVRAFALGYTTEDRVDTVAGGDAAGAGSETLLFGYSTAVSADARDLDSNQSGIGQYVLPSLPAGVSSYTVTRIRVRAKRSGGTSGVSYARLYDTSGGLPTGSVLAEETLYESTLSSGIEWVDITFSNPPTRLAGEAIAVAMEWGSDRDSAVIEFDIAGTSGGLLTRNKETDPWVNTGGKNLLLEVYGTCACVTPDMSMTRQVRTCAHITLQVGDSTAQNVSTRMYREPGVHTAAWDTEFDASPVGIDMDGNGNDWAIDIGGAAGSFANGVWTADGRINIEPAHAFLDPVVVDVVLGSTTNGQDGAKFGINADRDGGLVARLVLQAGLDATGSHYVRLRNNPNTMVRLEATDLGPNLPHVRLLISPADDTVGLIVNGQPVGTYVYERENDAGITFSALVAEFSDGVIDSVSIREGATAVVTSSGGGGTGSGGTGTGGTGASAGVSTPAGSTEASTSDKPSWAWW